jgi:hypothetical protein
VALTFDAEREYGSRARGHPTGANISTFLDRVSILPKSTVFIEGRFIADHAERLRAVEERGIEIGLHGYDHELWGPAQWYLRERPASPEQRADLLDRALENFKRSGLRRPLCFRAPNLVSDFATSRLLLARGFAVDSSQASHRGLPPIPNFSDGLAGIPVSVDPQPLLAWKGIFPYYRFVVCNFETLTSLPKEQVLYHVSRIAALQKLLDFPPHLVFLAHSWEFITTPRTSHANKGESNGFHLLKDLIRTLTDNYQANFLTLSSLAELLRGKPAKGRDSTG